MVSTAPQRLLDDKKALSAFYPSDAGAANNLFAFMAQRWNASYPRRRARRRVICSGGTPISSR